MSAISSPAAAIQSVEVFRDYSDLQAAPRQRSSAHIPALDGLRGLAIVLVLLFHFVPLGGGTTTIGWVTKCFAALGWCGVDLFFVLSGFLITGILFDAKGSEHYFRNFYMRRVLRIFPLYFGVLILIFMIIPLWRPMTSYDDQRLVANQQWLWLYAANIPPAMTNNWPLSSNWVRLSHFWSLAVEEHFYLVWPAVVFLYSRKTLMKICAALMVAGLICRTLAYFYINHLAAYALTPCRMDELALGALIGLASKGAGGIKELVRGAKWVAGISAIALAIIWSRQKESLNYTLSMSVVSIFFGAVLVLGVNGQIAGKLFSNPVMRFFGKYSYGIYVFHWMLAPFFNEVFGYEKLIRMTGSRVAGVGLSTAIAITISTAVGMLSWHLFEKHMLKLKRYFEYGESWARNKPISSLVALPSGT
jgi:peptidoglycan/LPS O-acetylase OafA/YrhL